MVDGRNDAPLRKKSHRLWEASPSGMSTRSVNVAAKLISLCAVIGLLYWAQAVIFPLVLAILLTFVLSPPVAALYRRGWPRVPTVLGILSSVIVLIGLVFWLVGTQLQEFGHDLPSYRDTIKQKLADVRRWYRGGTVERAQETIKEVNEELKKEEDQQEKKLAREKAKQRAGSDADGSRFPTLTMLIRRAFAPERAKPPPGKNPLEARADGADSLSKSSPNDAGNDQKRDTDERTSQKPVLVEVKPRSNSLNDVLSSASPMLAPVATVGLVFVLVLFMLLKYDDLRDRFVVAIGFDNIALTMKALEDATGRISRFLLMQLVINVTFGIVVAIGLAILGVPYAILWGLAAAVFRYIPFVGPWIAATLPIAVSLITSPGWSQVVGVVALFLVLELLSNNLMEPLLYGRSVGVSELGILVSAAFWTWLWGPMGLLLSTPMTVVLVVMGQYARPLSIFPKLLGNDALNEPSVNYFQRALTGDRYDARKILRQHIRAGSLTQCFDEVIQPALSLVRREFQNGILDECDVRRVCELTTELLEEVASEAEPESSPNDDAAADSTSTASRFRKLYGCAAHHEIDAVGLVALNAVMRARGRVFEVLDEELLASEQIEQIEDGAIVCISTTWPDNLDHCRYLCKRLRQSIDHVTIFVGRWGAESTDADDLHLEQNIVLVATRMGDLENRLLAQMRIEPPAADGGKESKTSHVTSTVEA